MPDEITAEHVAEMHQMDLKVQHNMVVVEPIGMMTFALSKLLIKNP